MQTQDSVRKVLHIIEQIKKKKRKKLFYSVWVLLIGLTGIFLIL